MKSKPLFEEMKKIAKIPIQLYRKWRKDESDARKIAIIFGPLLFLFLTLVNKNERIIWIDEMINADSHRIIIEYCDGNRAMDVNLGEYRAKILSNKWNLMSKKDNLSWNKKLCYTNLNISYQNNDLIKEIQIIFINDYSIVLVEDDNITYYTNANEVIEFFNKLFHKN